MSLFWEQENCIMNIDITDVPKNENVKLNKTIWILWLQGLEKAPKLVQKCYESVCKNKLDEEDIVLLTEQNLSSYVQLPDYVWTKYDEQEWAIIKESFKIDKLTYKNKIL